MSDYPRWQEKRLKEALKTRRVVMLTGPRQSGKTTLARRLVSEKTVYRTLDDTVLRQAAESDPHLFVNYGTENGALIIDEVQKVPELLSAIKKVVDQNNRPGQFLITGSANILTLPTVTESMAGRIGKIRLRPLSQGEIDKTHPCFLERAFSQTLTGGKTRHSRDELLHIIFRGGFPEAVRLESRARKGWHRDYVDALIEHDLNDFAHIRQIDLMRDLVRILAAWSTKYMDMTSIGSGLSLDRRTLANYISALKSFYIVETIPAWRKTDYDRIGKLDKVVMTDTGMMAALLDWKLSDLTHNPDKLGKIVETFVYNELAAQIEAADTSYHIYQYRDREKREIDFLIEREDHSLLAIEVKSGMTVKKSDFKHIQWFQAHLAKERSLIGIILYMGENLIPFGDNRWAVPLDYLWGYSRKHEGYILKAF